MKCAANTQDGPTPTCLTFVIRREELLAAGAVANKLHNTGKKKM